MIRRAVALVAAVIVLTACGGDGGGRFDDQVAAVREAVEAGDRAGAVAGLDRIAVLALDGYQQGDLSEAQVAEVAALVEQGRALIDDQLPAPTPAPTPAPPPDGPVTGESAEGGGEDDRDDDDRDDDDRDDDDRDDDEKSDDEKSDSDRGRGNGKDDKGKDDRGKDDD